MQKAVCGVENCHPSLGIESCLVTFTIFRYAYICSPRQRGSCAGNRRNMFIEMLAAADASNIFSYNNCSARNSCYSVQMLLSSRHLSKKFKIKTYQT